MMHHSWTFIVLLIGSISIFAEYWHTDIGYLRSKTGRYLQVGIKGNRIGTQDKNSSFTLLQIEGLTGRIVHIYGKEAQEYFCVNRRGNPSKLKSFMDPKTDNPHPKLERNLSCIFEIFHEDDYLLFRSSWGHPSDMERRYLSLTKMGKFMLSDTSNVRRTRFRFVSLLPTPIMPKKSGTRRPFVSEDCS